jgi:tripeptidyl-peptidase I
MTLRIAVKQQNVNIFEEKLLNISTPGYEDYGKHMSRDEVHELLKPANASVEVVVSWLTACNITYQINSDWIKFETSVRSANQLLGTDFLLYRNQENATMLRTLQYSVPDDVADHINLVQPTTRFGDIQSMRAALRNHRKTNTISKHTDCAKPKPVKSNCNNTITPSCLLDLYNVQLGIKVNNGNRIGFASFLKEYSRYQDLASFERQFAPHAIGQNFSEVQFNNGANNQTDQIDDSVEANLDSQYIVGLSHPIPVVEFSTGGLG